LLIAGAIVLVATNVKEIREINIFAGVLVVQSLPFIAAVGLALVERTRLNDFAYWRSLDTRLAELVGRRALVAKVVTTAPAVQVVKVQEQRELVQ
jgi:hypothetical protein